MLLKDENSLCPMVFSQCICLIGGTIGAKRLCGFIDIIEFVLTVRNTLSSFPANSFLYMGFLLGKMLTLLERQCS